MARLASCHCLGLELECEGEPAKISLCNCLDCQRRTGSLFSVAAFFPREAVRIVKGEAASFSRSSASGHPVTFHFCGRCGSSLWWAPERMPHLVGVAVGAFADPSFPMPAQAVWTADKHQWLTFPDAIPLHDRNPPPKGAASQDCALQKGRNDGSSDPSSVQILPYDPRHFAGVDGLWKTCFPDDPAWNRAAISVADKLQFQPGLLFVAEINGNVAGTAMAGYDGHRGWLYAIAVHPDQQRTGIGTMLVRHAEEILATLGCRKINLQMRAENDRVAAFYRRLGYTAEARISMGKLLKR